MRPVQTWSLLPVICTYKGMRGKVSKLDLGFLDETKRLFSDQKECPKRRANEKSDIPKPFANIANEEKIKNDSYV